MEIQDIYSLFGNALDNAITAVSGLEDPEKRVIFMKVHIQDSFLSIHFENGFAGKLKYDSNAQIMTTKEDREIHGYGLKSIQRVVGKYNGEVSISAEDHRFVLNLIFPLENGVIADPIDL
jgi:sensor histidine kinase regulating citrate/malate metabolism